MDERVSMSDHNSAQFSVAKVAQYFNVLPPHTAREKAARSPQWAKENALEIEDRLLNEGPKVWYSKIELIRGSEIYSPGHQANETPAEVFFGFFGIARPDLKGKRVLDIGAFSGAMTFFAEDCGAEVVALDIQNPGTNGFGLIHDLRQSTTTHVIASVYDLHPSLFGKFDFIVFSGVHYHLKHPLLALERLNALMEMGGVLMTSGASADHWLSKPGADDTVGVDLSRITKQTLSAEMSVDQINDIPLLGFYRDTYLRDNSNWFIPNTAALSDMITASGFSVLAAGTYPMQRLDLNQTVSLSLIKAVRVGDPVPEYSSDVYANVRRFDAVEDASPTFAIPTWFELEEARRNSATT